MATTSKRSTAAAEGYNSDSSDDLFIKIERKSRNKGKSLPGSGQKLEGGQKLGSESGDKPEVKPERESAVQVEQRSTRSRASRGNQNATETEGDDNIAWTPVTMYQCSKCPGKVFKKEEMDSHEESHKKGTRKRPSPIKSAQKSTGNGGNFAKKGRVCYFEKGKLKYQKHA